MRPIEMHCRRVCLAAVLCVSFLCVFVFVRVSPFVCCFLSFPLLCSVLFCSAQSRAAQSRQLLYICI